MKTERNILIAFLLNLVFSMIELVGGIWTGSVAIISDSVHDFGDALSIGVSFFLERKSKRQPDAKYNYGYARFSVLGAMITAAILIVGSAFVIVNAAKRFWEPVEIDYSKMIGVAVVGVVVNSLAAYATSRGKSLNQKSVNLHMLEDVLGWVVVLIGAIIMHFTDWAFVDPLMSIGVAIYILIEACRNMRSIVDLFLVRTPRDLDTGKIQEDIRALKGIQDVHHLHFWSLDGESYYATLHIRLEEKGARGSKEDALEVHHNFVTEKKAEIRKLLEKYEIDHVTIEVEEEGEECEALECVVASGHAGHGHGHEHGHGHSHGGHHH